MCCCSSFYVRCAFVQREPTGLVQWLCSCGSTLAECLRISDLRPTMVTIADADCAESVAARGLERGPDRASWQGFIQISCTICAMMCVLYIVCIHTSSGYAYAKGYRYGYGYRYGHGYVYGYALRMSVMCCACSMYLYGFIRVLIIPVRICVYIYARAVQKSMRPVHKARFRIFRSLTRAKS